MKKLFFLALLMSVFTVSFAQNKISGTIVDEKNGKGIPFVNVGLFRQADSVFVSGAASDDKGAFALQGVPRGNYDLKISAIGYQTYEQVLEVNGNVDLGKLKMKEGSTTLSEVVISEKRPLFAVEGEKSMYNVAEDPSIQTGTASDALQNAPGVEVDVEGNVTLRGTSSVEVWINDKPSHMNEENLKTYLQTLPANSIDRVEVITNPSARYGSKADGIINIVTNAKVQKNEFFSFGVNASTKPFVSPWLSYVWQNEKLTINAYANFNYSRNKYFFNSDQWIGQPNDDNAWDTISHKIDENNSISRSYSGGAYLNLTYEIDSMNELSFWGNCFPSMSVDTSWGSSFRQEFVDNPGSYNYLDNTMSRNTHMFAMGGLYYQHKFDNEGHNLSVSVNANTFGFNSKQETDRLYTTPFERLRSIQWNNGSSNAGVEGEIIYNRPYSKDGEISAGYSSSYDPERSHIVYDTLSDNEYVHDLWRTYNTKGYEWENEAFITLQHKFGGFTVKPGIRFCHEMTGIAYSETNQNVPDTTIHFFNVRPSLHLSYRTKSMHNFKLNYTRRISNPSASQLSTFYEFEEESFSQGNPELIPVFTNSFEIGWTKYWNSFGSIGLSGYYRGKSNEINQIMVTQTYLPLYDYEVPFRYPVNVGKSSNAGAEFNMMYRPNAMLNLRFYANVYNSTINTSYDDLLHQHHEVHSSMWSYSFRLNFWTKLWNKLEVHASARYNSPTQGLYSMRKARYGIDCGLRADFFDKKMSVFVNAQDLLNSASWGQTNESPYIHSTSDSKFNMRSISVGVTFRFGKMELESAARQGSEDTTGGAKEM
ncbi:MAG: outer membrane beta-barrel protein [Bacteroidales bacterium]|nr:outer membrane beta-barrel protein [Bacteroidales bacterium]